MRDYTVQKQHSKSGQKSSCYKTFGNLSGNGCLWNSVEIEFTKIEFRREYFLVNKQYGNHSLKNK